MNIRIICLTALLACATIAQGGIASISAHGRTFTPGRVIPLFVSTERHSVIVKGQFMDLCTGVESNDSSFTVSIGRRVMGANSSVEIFVKAENAPDGDEATIKIKFVAGEETFRVRAFKTNIRRIYLSKAAFAQCRVGDLEILVVEGEGMNHLVKTAAGAMLDVADNRYEIQEKLSISTDNHARFAFRCTSQGEFTVSRSWFGDSRLSDPLNSLMVRGDATLRITSNPREIIRKTPVP